MKLSHLIAVLQAYALEHPDDPIVSIDGYEGGVGDIKPANIYPVTVSIDENKDSDYYAPHDIVSEHDIRYNKEWGYRDHYVYEKRLLISRNAKP